ncbi:MAG: retron St85 family effector protein [Methylocystis sp.]
MFLPSKGKEQLIDEIVSFYSDLNQDKLRVARPTKVVFFCGGVISRERSDPYKSLRDYLYRSFQVRSPLKGHVVLAEEANQLYRETDYHDLISFEEDIAHIASVILVVAESPGSLAELGAFASNEHIRAKLRLILEEQYANEESFIRFGPVERIKRDSGEFVGFYPWRKNRSGKLVLRSASPHKKEMIDFINGHLDSAPKSELLVQSANAKDMFIVYWIVFISFAIHTKVLYKVVDAIGIGLSETKIRNILYCLQLVGWIRVLSYSGKDYFYALIDRDPFDYSFKDGAAVSDSSRRKADIAQAISRATPLPRHVKQTVANSRLLS